MHEYGITARLFQVALEQANLQDGERLQRLAVSLDPNAGFAPDAIRFYFAQIAKDTAAEGAELAFELVEQPQQIRLTSLEIEEVEPSSGPIDHGQITRWQIHVAGAVQGVGFRPFVHNLATTLQLCGWVRNSSCGVEMELQGPTSALQHFRHHLENDGPPLARIMQIAITECPLVPDAEPGVQILPSQPMNGRTLISPDVATCAYCLHELFDPADRRYRYPFINCTHCGPRFSIITDLPYDRPKSTMADFPLCDACADEYHDTTDRRFHAQPVACTDCGPAIWFEHAGVHITETDAALAATVDLLAQNGIVAIKGLGGFHLACRADRAAAVQRLRERKQRPTKPFAIMVRNVQEAALYCDLNATEEQLLLAPEAPIVLLRKRATILPNEIAHKLADRLAPANAYIGVMLPYTPLHHLLLQAVNAPLVMTSGNRGGDPLCIDNADAQAQLDFADGFLLHNRPIARRCDDSVMFVAHFSDEQGAGEQGAGEQGAGEQAAGEQAAGDGGAGPITTQMIRRSRGLAPLPILLPTDIALDCAMLATGADLKNVSAVAVDQQVFLTQHIGDLRGLGARTEQTRALDDLARLFHIDPQLVVCDLHPDYASSRYARVRATREELPLVEVQHHHAHIAACMAENHQIDPVIGLAFDGTGDGTDGHSWGGEAMVADLRAFTRICQLEYLPLPGGDAAIQHPSRITYAYLRTLLPEIDAGQFLPALSTAERRVIDTMLAQQLNTPQTSSMGRLFDAVSALLGLCTQVTHEAEAAIALEAAALQHDNSKAESTGYPFTIEAGQVQLEQLFAAILAAVGRGTSGPEIAHRFHRTVATMAVTMAIDTQHAMTPKSDDCLTTVALSGGVWQNRLLLEMTVPMLQAAGFTVLLHHHVPANDGGIAYGQIAIAAARQRAVT